MASTEPFPELDELADFYLFQQHDEDAVAKGVNLEPASPGETRHLRHRLRQLTASSAKESRFSKALAVAEASDDTSQGEVEYCKQQAFWAERDYKRQKDLMRDDELVQRYEASNPADPLGLRANASSWKVNWKHENGEPQRGESWNNYFTRERRRVIDSWTPSLHPAETKEELARRRELDDQYEYSERVLQQLRREKEEALRRERQEYPSNIMAAGKRRHESQTRKSSFDASTKEAAPQDTTAAKDTPVGMQVFAAKEAQR